ncbi:MAG: DUF6941 family protein [Betaproteobacteria bacterium]
MPRAKLVAWADNVIVDQQTNNTSLIEVIEEITAPAFPLVIPRLCVFFLLEKQEGDQDRIQGEVRFTSNGVETNRFAMDVNFQGKLRARQIVMLGGFLVREPGILKTSLIIGEREIASYEVPVMGVAAPQVAARTG